MAKIILNNKEFNIDDAVIASINEGLKNHLLTTMSGTGATITLDGTTYNVDSTKLATAKNDFVAHLGTIAGEGVKIVIGGVEYSVDSAKMTGIIAGLEGAFSELENGGEPDLGFPIVWNSMDVLGNPTFIFDDQISFVKVSDFTPTAKELLTTGLLAAGDYLPCQMAQDRGEFAIAMYGDSEIQVFSVFTAGEYTVEGVVLNIPEAGFYALDLGIVGWNYDFVIDLASSTT
jgi:hypothetical protein